MRILCSRACGATVISKLVHARVHQITAREASREVASMQPRGKKSEKAENMTMGRREYPTKLEHR